MLTQPASPAPTLPGAPQGTATPAAKTFWQRADDITGIVLFAVIMVGGVVAPFALYIYGVLFR